MNSTLEFLVYNTIDEETLKVINKVEKIRKLIASEGNKEVEIWYSPKPGSSGNNVDPTLRPKPGKTLKFTMEQISRTGKDRRWGTVLYLLARDFNSTMVFELGSCAGISACYLSSAPSVRSLITVEGSKELAKIARESLDVFKNKARVVNCLFDEAIDQELSNIQKQIDYAYIDGHHEKIATIHYFERIKPYLADKALVVFDDISWSYDMKDAWDVLSKREEFTHCIDLGSIGVCVFERTCCRSRNSMYWNLQSIVGRVTIGDPLGWKK